eukprot:1586841-Alexandrium_andersonii.AAC.1
MCIRDSRWKNSALSGLARKRRIPPGSANSRQSCRISLKMPLGACSGLGLSTAPEPSCSKMQLVRLGVEL